MGCGKFHEFHDCSEQRDRMEMLRIFQVAAVFFGILMEKISRVQTAGRKMIGRGQAWYAAAWAIGDVGQVMEVCEMRQMQAQDMMVWLHQERKCAEIGWGYPAGDEKL